MLNSQINVPNPARGKHPKPVFTQHGVSHMTPASRHMHALAFGTAASALRRVGSSKRRKSRGAVSAAPTGKKRKKKGKKGTAAHMVKGSPAAKRHMAKLRKMVGKKKG